MEKVDFYMFLETFKYNTIMKKLILIISGSSGVGKGTIVKKLIEDKSLQLVLSVSATSRKKRDGEINGKHYNFFSKRKFKRYIRKNKFIEFSEHFDNLYGTLYSEIKKAHEKNKIPLLEIEVDGAKNVVKEVQKGHEYRVLSIYILPPSKEVLVERLNERGSETHEQISKRLERYSYEVKHKENFTYQVVNDDLGKAIEEIKRIIKKEKEVK